jgi:8-oxo-dGTP pyrophosphatase MutT (NUDIX family)
VSKLEYFFFARTSDELAELESDEIYDTTWVEIDELLEMEA